MTKDEENKIINDLEERLARLTSVETEKQKIDPWAAEAAAERLAAYYRKNQRNDDVKRVILEVGKSYDKIMSNASASAMQASGWLDHLHKLYKNFNLKEEAEVILLRIRELGPKVTAELKPISHSFELPKEEMDAYIKEMTTGEIKQVLLKIATQYVPNKEEIKEQIFDLSKKSPLSFLFSQHIQDEKGRVVATVGSLENDLEGHVVIQISQSLSFSSIFLRTVFQEATNKKVLTKEGILKFIDDSPIISKDRMPIIDRGVEAYFQNDFLVCIHLLVPQIEEAVRNIVEFSGGTVLKPSKSGGYHLRTFEELLRDEVIKEVLGEDFADYFRILYTDQRGWNIRNSVCHGMMSPNMFNFHTADRVIHSLICLGFIHENKQSQI